jgi:hypothetical protein
MGFYRRIIKRAEKLGWTYTEPPLPKAWTALYIPAARRGIAKHLRAFAKRWPSPLSVTEEEIREWIKAMVQGGRSLWEVRAQANKLRKVLVEAGINVDQLSAKVMKPSYGIPFPLLPDMLRLELETLMRWKTDKYVLGRPRKGRIRAITASGLRSVFCQLFGFAANRLGRTNILTIHELITEEIVGHYIGYALNERELQGLTIRTELGKLRPRVCYGLCVSSLVKLASMRMAKAR